MSYWFRVAVKQIVIGAAATAAAMEQPMTYQQRRKAECKKHIEERAKAVEAEYALVEDAVRRLKHATAIQVAEQVNQKPKWTRRRLQALVKLKRVNRVGINGKLCFYEIWK